MSLPPLWGQRAPSSPQVLERRGPEQLCPPLEIEKGIRARADDTLSFALSSVLAGVSVLGRLNRVPHPREDTRAPARCAQALAPARVAASCLGSPSSRLLRSPPERD